MHQSWERNDPIHLIRGADREAAFIDVPSQRFLPAPDAI